MRFAILRNGKNVGEDGFELGDVRETRMVPVITGAKRAGVLQTVLGIVLIITSFFLAPGSQAAGSGCWYDGRRRYPDTTPTNLLSYAFGSAKNTTASGNPVPICIGHRRWGGAIISASIYAKDKV